MELNYTLNNLKKGLEDWLNDSISERSRKIKLTKEINSTKEWIKDLQNIKNGKWTMLLGRRYLLSEIRAIEKYYDYLLTLKK